jgi:hypothetical protein
METSRSSVGRRVQAAVWGAAALFQGIRNVICVRVCAPMALRVRVMMERLGVKDAEADKRLSRGRQPAPGQSLIQCGTGRDKAEKLAQAIVGAREIDNRIISVPSRG